MRFWLLGLILFNLACREDLQLDPRQAWKTAEIVQTYEVDVFYSASGFAYYVARGMLATETQYASKGLPLPTGDRLLLNEGDLSWSEMNADYRTTGTVLPKAFTFTWTHEGATYTNTITAKDNPPVSIPATLSKAEGLTLSIASLPAGTSALAWVNAGVTVQAPFYPLPIEKSGTLESVDSDLSNLAPGPGILTLLETQSGDLQAGTAAGGTLTLHIQYGYHITIEE